MAIEPTRGVTRWTRSALGLQVVLVVLLGIVAAALVIHVFDRAALRTRVDFTLDKRNSLDPQTLALLDQLPGTADVDLFLRAPNQYLRPVWQDAVSRGKDLILVAREVAPQKIFQREHDLADLPAVEARLEELGVDPQTLQTQTPYGDLLAAAVISIGERRTVLRFLPDAGDADWGDPMRRVAPRLLGWRGEEAFAEALAKVATSDRPKVYFSTGHGEADFQSPDLDFGKSLTAFADDLVSEGFELGVWDVAREGPVPDDADVLVVASPREPFSEAGLSALRAYLARGGRALVSAPERYEEQDPMFPFLIEYGMVPQRGIVCQAIVDPNTGRTQEGGYECAQIRVSGKNTSSSHPVTRLLWERDRNLLVVFSRSFQRGQAPNHGLLFDLVATAPGCWLDLPSADGAPDFRYDGNTEERGQFRLAMAATWPVKLEDRTREGRLLALPGSALIEDQLYLYNRDFALSGMDWLADRAFRVRITQKDPFRSRLDLQRDSGVSALLFGLRYGLPLVCLLLGGVLFFLRRR